MQNKNFLIFEKKLIARILCPRLWGSDIRMRYNIHHNVTLLYCVISAHLLTESSRMDVCWSLHTTIQVLEAKIQCLQAEIMVGMWQDRYIILL